MEQHRKPGQSRPQQRRGSQAVQGAHFAEHPASRPQQQASRRGSSGTPQQRHVASQQRTRRPAEQHVPQHAQQTPQKRPAQQHAQQNRSQRPVQRRPMQQHPAANSQRRPQQNRPYPSGQRQRPQQRPAGYGTRSAAARRPQNRRAGQNAAARSGSRTMFILFLLLYIAAGIIIIRAVVRKANGYMQEYEESRPKYKIADYVSNMGSGFYNDMLEQAVQKLELSEYEPASSVLKKMKTDSGASGNAPYTYKKTEDFSDSKPSYYILRDEKVIARLGIERSGWTAKYSFPEWRVAEPVSMMEIDSEPVYSLSVTMPRGSKLRVNGKQVDEELFRETESELILTKTEQQYMKQPVSVKCEMTGLYVPPDVSVTDADGRTLEPERVPDASEADQVYLFTRHDAGTPDEDLLKRAEELTKAYIDYVINKDADRYNNIAKLNNYLLPGSDAAVLMQSLLNDVYWNNPYTSRTDKIFKVEHVRMYSEKLCTVDVHFDTTLTKQVTNEYAATVRWVMVNNGFTWYATSMKLLQSEAE